MKNLILVLLLGACSTLKDPGQKAVAQVELQRFMGNWFEVARYETPMQSECGQAKITYKPLGKKIDVLHACQEKETGKTVHAHGVAEVVDKNSHAKWKVSYFPIFQKWGVFGGSVWIIGLDPDYQYAVLGHPTHKHFWILSRTPEISPEKYEELVTLAEKQGYKRKLIQRVPTWK